MVDTFWTTFFLDELLDTEEDKLSVDKSGERTSHMKRLLSPLQGTKMG